MARAEGFHFTCAAGALPPMDYTGQRSGVDFGDLLHSPAADAGTYATVPHGPPRFGLAESRGEQTDQSGSQRPKLPEPGWPPTRAGAWTGAEVKYMEGIIDSFDKGLLGCANGMTLRLLLTQVLACDGMRVTRKFRKMGLSASQRSTKRYTRQHSMRSPEFLANEARLTKLRLEACISFNYTDEAAEPWAQGWRDAERVLQSADAAVVACELQRNKAAKAGPAAVETVSRVMVSRLLADSRKRRRLSTPPEPKPWPAEPVQAKPWPAVPGQAARPPPSWNASWLGMMARPFVPPIPPTVTPHSGVGVAPTPNSGVGVAPPASTPGFFVDTSPIQSQRATVGEIPPAYQWPEMEAAALGLAGTAAMAVHLQPAAGAVSAPLEAPRAPHQQQPFPVTPAGLGGPVGAGFPSSFPLPPSPVLPTRGVLPAGVAMYPPYYGGWHPHRHVPAVLWRGVTGSVTGSVTGGVNPTGAASASASASAPAQTEP